MDKKFVIHNGVEMMEGWPEQIQEAQQNGTYGIAGKQVDRIRYGEEKVNGAAGNHPCLP